MYSVLFPVGLSQQDELITFLWECGTTGIIEEGQGLRAFFDSPSAMEAVIMRYPDCRISTDESPSQQTALYASDWEPVLIGNRFIAGPSWLDYPVPVGRMKLAFDNGFVFGTGRHESTQLIIEALEILDLTNASVLDIGCGSGILSVAATLLGAPQVYACDLERDALEEAKRHLQSNVFYGSADAIRTGLADVVMANLTTPILNAIAPDLLRICKPGGQLLIAGFLTDNPPKEFSPDAMLERDGWACWICRR